MKKLLVACAVGAVAISPAVAIAAPAAAPKTTNGKTVSFAAGRLRVTSSKGTFTYLVGKATDCGYSRGQTGNQIRCADLKQKRYARQSVTVRWHLDAKRRRVAELVAVHLR